MGVDLLNRTVRIVYQLNKWHSQVLGEYVFVNVLTNQHYIEIAFIELDKEVFYS